MKSLLILLAVIVKLASCSPIQSVNFSNDLRKDTVCYSGTTDQLGPYSVQVTPVQSGNKIREGIFATRQEEHETFGFSLCGFGNCLDAQSIYYKKTKTNSLNLIKTESEKISGHMYYNKTDTLNFLVNATGKQAGTGFLRLPDGEMITVRPISKKSTYGKSPFGVGLEFLFQDRLIGSFIQTGELITVVILKNEPEKIKMLVSALSIALVNRTNQIRIL